MTLHASPIGS